MLQDELHFTRQSPTPPRPGLTVHKGRSGEQSKKPQAAPRAVDTSGAAESESLLGMDHPWAWVNTAGLRFRIWGRTSKEIFTDTKTLGTWTYSWDIRAFFLVSAGSFHFVRTSVQSTHIYWVSSMCQAWCWGYSGEQESYFHRAERSGLQISVIASPCREKGLPRWC